MFLDADDYLKIDACRLLTDNLEHTHADMCCFRIETTDRKGRNYVIGNNFEFSTIEDSDVIIKDALTTGNIKTSVWCKMYLTSFLLKNNLTFTGGTMHEDTAYTIMLAALIKKVSFLNIPLYHIEQNPNSKTRQYKSTNITAYFSIFQKIKDFYTKLGLFEQYQMYINCQYILCILNTLISIAYNTEYSEFIKFYQLLSNGNYDNIIYAIKLKGWPYYILAIISKQPKIFYYTIKILKKLGYKRYN